MDNLNTSMRTHTCGELTKNDNGKNVTLIGWVNRKREHGAVIFIDLRDRYGITQLVIHPEKEDLKKLVQDIKPEFVISVTGTVSLRPGKMINPSLKTGEIEIDVEDINIINPSLTTPFVIEEEVKAQEELRLTYRYLDLRRRKMLKHFIQRHTAVQSIRDFLIKNGFLEIETPILAKSTPEGARDFLVPSRMEKGKFYALAQSPQLYKQILMVAGFDRYFQFAKCLRDEDLRGDRQPEHTQIDIEMSFINEEDVYSLTEQMMQDLFYKTLGIEIHIPFKRIEYSDAMERFGTDKPDLRFPLEISDFTEVAKTGDFKVFNNSSCVKGIKVRRSFTRKEIDALGEIARKNGAAGLLWLSKNGDYKGPFVKYFKDLSIFGLKDGETVFFIAGDRKTVLVSLGELRKELGKTMVVHGDFQFVWITNFPLFERDNETDNLLPSHHIFTMPLEEDLPLLETEPDKVRGRQYDLVINGIEVASGSIRNHNAEMQKKLFRLIGLDDKQIEDRFGFLINALSYGAPPHGGIAPGIDRICMIIEGSDTIRDVIAFPKTLTGRGLLERTPSFVEKTQLDELGIEVKKDE